MSTPKTTTKLLTLSLCQLSSLPQLETTLSSSFMLTCPKTEDKLMESSSKQACSTLLNPGEQVELLPEFQELEDLVPADQDREPSLISAEREECSHHSKPTEDGTEK